MRLILRVRRDSDDLPATRRELDLSEDHLLRTIRRYFLWRLNVEKEEREK